MSTIVQIGEDCEKAKRRPVLCFDVVIVTRNRPEALELSIPLILTQSRQPERLIVIDSSDDHAPVADAVARLTRDWGGEVYVEHCEKGLCYQRNIGMAYVMADVVVFPDDDSLFFPGALEAIMAAYERDTDQAIVGVCAAEAIRPPEGAGLKDAYQMSREHIVEAQTRLWRNRLEKRVQALKPVLFLGQTLAARHDAPDWLDAQNCVVVEYMTGFRMSFRSDAIKAVGFDETLREYGLEEDVDASLSVARAGLLVGARDAKVYHHRFPGGRGDPRMLGAIQILNRIYVVLKHAAAGAMPSRDAARARRRLSAFILIKLVAGLPGLRHQSGRERFAGAWAASRMGRRLWRDTPEALSAGYEQAMNRIKL
ncbi:MAG: glycosyltransferase [Pseudomonadota bacterium]